MLCRAVAENEVDCIIVILRLNQSPENRHIGKIRNEHAFINLHPDFVARVNELLQPDQRFAPIAEGASLSAELRMLALMISGISDSTRLARFLGLSLNTVYTYRTRLKGRALDRENFEEKLRKIYEIPDAKLIFESSGTSDN